MNKSTIQLFTAKELEEPVFLKPKATGVLLYVKGKHILVSAGHVFNDEDKLKIGFIMSDGSFILLKGHLCFVNPNVNEIHYAIDYSYYILCDDIVDFLLKENYEFITEENCVIHFKFGQVVFMGFPSSKTDIWYMNSKEAFIKRRPITMYTSVTEDKRLYEKYHLIEQYNICIDYPKKMLNNHNLRVHTPAQYGLSGCGLWTIINGESYLLGLLTSFAKKDSILWGIKIGVIIEDINNNFKL